MFGIRKKIRLITHNNHFHADDVFATATLLLALKKEIGEVEIIRTRNKEVIESGDYVYDVGGIYDANKNRFDHHQEGGAGERENGIPYSSFGLVWKKFGVEICGSQEIADVLDAKIVQPVDAMDNGIKTHKALYSEIEPYLIQNVIFVFNPAWPEKENFDKFFLKAVEMVKWILGREIVKAQDIEKAKSVVDGIYNKTEDKRIILLDENYPWESILDKYEEPLFVVKPRSEGKWSVKAVPVEKYSFVRKKYFPKSWAGKTGEKLAEITGVKDAVFCHNARFVCAAKSKEGAIKLAKLALLSEEK